VKNRNCLPVNFAQFMQRYGSQASSSHHLSFFINNFVYANVHKEILGQLSDPAQRARFLSQSAPGANRLFSFDLSDPNTRVGNVAYQHFFRSHLGLPPSPVLSRFPRAKCQCGFLIANDSLHFSTCVFTKNTIGQLIHKMGINVVARCGQLCGVPTEQERHLLDGKRTDVTLHFPQFEQPIDTDLSFTNPSAPTYRKTRASIEALSAAQHRCREKIKKYRAAVEREGCRFLPMVWESYGAMAGSTLFAFQALHAAAQFYGRTDAPSIKTMKDWAARELIIGNSLMIQRGLQNMKLHASKA
jgi:hypothetical protein